MSNRDRIAITGEYGLSDIFLSLPCILGAGGVARVLPPDLADDEIASLRASAATLREALSRLD